MVHCLPTLFFLDAFHSSSTTTEPCSPTSSIGKISPTKSPPAKPETPRRFTPRKKQSFLHHALETRKRFKIAARASVWNDKWQSGDAWMPCSKVYADGFGIIETRRFDFTPKPIETADFVERREDWRERERKRERDIQKNVQNLTTITSSHAPNNKLFFTHSNSASGAPLALFSTSRLSCSISSSIFVGKFVVSETKLTTSVAVLSKTVSASALPRRNASNGLSFTSESSLLLSFPAVAFWVTFRFSRGEKERERLCWKENEEEKAEEEDEEQPLFDERRRAPKNTPCAEGFATTGTCASVVCKLEDYLNVMSYGRIWWTSQLR